MKTEERKTSVSGHKERESFKHLRKNNEMSNSLLEVIMKGTYVEQHNANGKTQRKLLPRQTQTEA